VDLVPFESEHQYMATLRDAGSDQARIVYFKGSLEATLARCGGAIDAKGRDIPLDAEATHGAADEMASQGLRVLAFARKHLPTGTARLTHKDVGEGLTFLGLQGMFRCVMRLYTSRGALDGPSLEGASGRARAVIRYSWPC
jgi:Ca2+-transporting ATPase